MIARVVLEICTLRNDSSLLSLYFYFQRTETELFVQWSIIEILSQPGGRANTQSQGWVKVVRLIDQHVLKTEPPVFRPRRSVSLSFSLVWVLEALISLGFDLWS